MRFESAPPYRGLPHHPETQRASADAASPAARLRRLFERDGENEERQQAIIREFTRRTKRIEDMTPGEIQALISTRWPEEASASS